MIPQYHKKVKRFWFFFGFFDFSSAFGIIIEGRGGKIGVQHSRNIDWQRLAAMLFCLLVGLGLVFLVGKYLLIATLPFLIALGTALLLNPLAKLLAKRLGIPEKLCATILLLLFFFLIGLILVFTVNRLLDESGQLLKRLSEESDSLGAYLGALADRLSNLGDSLPILGDLGNIKGLEALDGYIDTLLSQIVESLTTAITTKIPIVIGGFISALPSFLLFFIISVMASFYFTLDLRTISGFFLSILPKKARARLPAIKTALGDFLKRYLRAYALILFLTFCELYVGFCVLSLEYSFLPALLIAFVDLLPVLGVGTVLIPWSAIMLLSGNYYLGFGLLILWGCITIVRQIIEPRILGGTLGVHPVLMLIAMYLAYRFFGFLGILLSPAAVMLIRLFLKEFGKHKVDSV